MGKTPPADATLTTTRSEAVVLAEPILPLMASTASLVPWMTALRFTSTTECHLARSPIPALLKHA